MRYITMLVLLVLILSSCKKEMQKDLSDHDLIFSTLPVSWDEGIPLGNGMLGALVWQKDSKLRISLDRVDLWDLRPMKNLDFNKFTYEWVYKQWFNNTYDQVQKQMDVPYNQRVAPTKIPAAALEFDIADLGRIMEVRLSLDKAFCTIKWDGGEEFRIFVNANADIGWYQFLNCDISPEPELMEPAYQKTGGKIEREVIIQADLALLGYKPGIINKRKNEIEYIQEGWGGFKYSVALIWDQNEDITSGAWSICSRYPEWEIGTRAIDDVIMHYNSGFEVAYEEHLKWWDQYWSRSSISIPDSLLEKQYYLEMYKFGSVARSNTPPISLQAVWTADNGKLPPWKGDFHHDLNTQLSYWPSYAGNQTELAEGFVNWLWKYKATFEKYTSEYYRHEGLNVPGVTTLMGEPMGGWIQYSLGPTVSAWLAHHFYQQWKYTMDREFLETRAYPWLKATLIHIDNLSVIGNDGLRKLPISSSPEIHDNSKEAWFGETTNFDLALIRWTYEKAAEMAMEQGLDGDAELYLSRMNEWPALAYDETGLVFAPGHPYASSHRHFSHLMGWHPLGLLDYSKEEDKSIIDNTLSTLETIGPDYWVGYSYSWLGNLYARAYNGDKAVEALSIFAKAFCLPNSFHVNGDQTRSGYSKYTYRPFTLEGNFAFASGVQEMLIQSHTGIIRIFPAIPSAWKELSFEKLRTEGAFLVSAEMKEGFVQSVKIESLAGATLRIESPFDTGDVARGEIIEKHTQKGDIIILKPETK